MKTIRSQEGYLLVDHRGSPGMPVLQSDLPVGAGQGMFEAPTFTCSHCQFVVVLNPARTRDRGHCKKCDHYVCDRCYDIAIKSGVCVPFRQIADELLEAAAKENLIKEF